MRLKKLLSAAMTAALVCTLFVMPVSAHGHHSRRVQAVDTSCPVCTVEDCTEEGIHIHDGHNYCGYNHADGYCDGSCVTAKTTSSYACRGRHHCH